MELQIFDQNFFFIKNDSLTTDNAILTTLPKIFLQKTTGLSLRFQERKREIINFLEGKIFFLKWCFCTFRIHLWPPVKNLPSKLLKLFARIPKRMKNLCAFQTKKFLPKKFVWTYTMNFWPAFRNFVAKKTENFPELQNCWSYNFLNKFVFFIKNDSLATENAILTTVANNFLWESTHLQLRFRKPRKKTLNFSKGK